MNITSIANSRTNIKSVVVSSKDTFRGSAIAWYTIETRSAMSQAALVRESGDNRNRSLLSLLTEGWSDYFW